MRLTGVQYFHRRRSSVGYAAFSLENACVQSSTVTSSAGYGELCRTESSADTVPEATSSISPLIAIIASMKRSSSYFDSDSVGSIINVPATGNDIVGAWKP